ncbi:MAG: AAA family ATPase [Acidimicrobiales bacterium]
MQQSLIGQVQARLAGSELEADARTVVLAACHGSEPLERALDTGEFDVADEGEAAVDPTEVYLTSIAVEGFRGIGPRAMLDLVPGPGLTLVVGRNGSGKSSFAEGLEMLLTGSNLRWADRASAWKDGWRNLHQATPTSVAAEFLLSGHQDAIEARRSWDAGADLDASTDQLVLPGQNAGSLTDLGWGPALDNYRPFLSYNELGSMLADSPASLHDAMSAFLGLDVLVVAQELLRKARLEREQPAKDLKKATQALITRLGESDDERAAQAIELLQAKKPEIDALAVLGGAAGSGADPDIATMAAVSTPELEDLLVAADELAQAIAGVTEAAGSQVGRLAQLAALLRTAHDHTADADSTACPVCGTADVIDDAWRRRTLGEVERLEAEAGVVRAATTRLDAARRAARTCIVGVPSVLKKDLSIAGAAAARDAWAAWSATPDNDVDLVERLRSFGPVAELVTAAKDEAAQIVASHDAAWQPHARAIAYWIDAHTTAEAATSAAKQIKVAETWLKDTIGDIRAERFAPIADQARHYWDTLRHRSNVKLEQVALEGSANQRRVSLEVTVDDTPASALGVMSQGELHALALSLFLPRATMPQSPFRFIVIDDPVQAMDPARVDGLAKVLEQVAKTHQLIVFTHDERLPESVQRLGIEAEKVQVTRQPGSRVSTRIAWDSVTTAIDDARAVARSKDLGLAAKRKIVPTYCRLALESASATAVRRRRIGAGKSHASVERDLERAKTLRDRLALALFDDSSRFGDVNDELRARSIDAGPTVLHWANAGAHGDFEGDPVKLIDDTEGLARYLASQR